MTAEEFKALKYGDLVSDGRRTLLVIHTSQDADAKTAAIGVIDGFGPSLAGMLTLVQAADPPQETALIDTDGKTRRGFLKTLPEAK